MHPLDKAEKIIRGIWPKKGVWIYESPDRGQTVFRRMSNDGKPKQLDYADVANWPKQLYYENNTMVADIETLDEEYMKLLDRG